MQYVIVGGLSVDHVANSAGERRLNQFGGNAAYGAAGARIWAAGQVGMVARMGQGFPEKWIAAAGKAGIDVAGVNRLDRPHTLGGGMVYDSRGDRDNYIAPADMLQAEGRGHKADMSPLLLHEAQKTFGADATDIPAAYNNAGAVHLAPRYLNNQLSCARYFRARTPIPRLILDPMHFYMHLERSDELTALFSLVDVVLPSEDELTRLFGPVEPELGARHLLDLGAHSVVVKLGGQGCLVYDGLRGKAVRVPVYKTAALDPTGAGDSFCGGFLVGWHETGDPVMAALYGTVSASCVVEGFGAEYSFSVSRNQAEARLNTLRAEVQAL